MEINITWNICRICLVEEPKYLQVTGVVEQMRHIFNEDKLLPKQIYECSGIAMKPNDNLPQKICKKCLTMVKYAVNFRKTCRASDSYLRSILQRTKSATELFKPEQPPLENLAEEVISNDCMTNESIKKELGETAASDPFKQSNTLKCEEIHLDKRTQRKGSNSSDIMINSDNLIEHNYEDMIENDLIVEEKDLLDLSESNINDMVINTKVGYGLDDNKVNDDVEIDTKSDENTSENCDFNESQEGDLNEDNYFDNNKNENSSHVSVASQQNSDDEDENSQLKNIERKGQHEILRHVETDMGDEQDLVSSTVATTEYDIEIHEENSNFSNDVDGVQTEYIVDEYLIDGSCSDTSQQKPAVVVINSKLVQKCTKPTENCGSANSRISKLPSKSTSESQIWICDLCGNHFNNRRLLNGHMKVHRQEKNHECEICLKRFITACNLKAHMRSHTGEKPFECQYCERRFSDRSTQLRHERTHTNEKPYECKECGKAFSLATTLKKHLKVHSSERSYKCDICVKSFKLPHQLKAHMKSTLHKAVEKLEQ